MARPTKWTKVDVEQLRQCAQKQWSNVEIAAHFRVSTDTIERHFAAIIKEARESGRAKLRDLQWKRALEGSDRMIMHMSEHYLGQHTKAQLDINKIPDEQLVSIVQDRLSGRKD